MQPQLSTVAGTDEQTSPVGFRMEGPFSTAQGDLAVLDLSYTRLLGGAESVTRVVSTGKAAYVVADGKTTEVPADRAGALALGDGAGGVGELGIAGWARDEKAEQRAVMVDARTQTLGL